jgi:hypothetical protein
LELEELGHLATGSLADPLVKKKLCRKLDRSLAEEVFDRDPRDARRNLHPEDPDELEYHWGYPGGHDTAPYYSTQAQASLQLREHMVELGYYWSHMAYGGGCYAPYHTVCFSTDGIALVPGAGATDEYLAWAIAALLAVRARAKHKDSKQFELPGNLDGWRLDMVNPDWHDLD